MDELDIKDKGILFLYGNIKMAIIYIELRSLLTSKGKDFFYKENSVKEVFMTIPGHNEALFEQIVGKYKIQ